MRHLDPNIVIKGALELGKIKSSVVAHQALTGLYESVYGIFDHTKNYRQPKGKKIPFSNQLFHPSEEFTKNSLLEENIRIFADLPIKDMWGINFDQFMKYPVDVVSMFVRLAREKKSKEQQSANALSNQLNSVVEDVKKIG